MGMELNVGRLLEVFAAMQKLDRKKPPLSEQRLHDEDMARRFESTLSEPSATRQRISCSAPSLDELTNTESIIDVVSHVGLDPANGYDCCIVTRLLDELGVMPTDHPVIVGGRCK